MPHWFRNLGITAKATLLLSLTAITFLLLLATSAYFFSSRTLLQTFVNDHPALSLQLSLAFAGLLLLGGIFVAVAVKASTAPIVKPLRQLSEHLRHLSEKQGDDRFLPVQGNDEIARLTRIFNELLQELDDEAAAREESLQIQQVVSEYINELAVWRSPDNTVRFISDNCLQLTGYHAGEFYANPDLLERLFYPADRPLWDSWHHEYTDDESHTPFEMRLIHKDGSLVWVRHLCHHTHDQEGNLTGRRGSFIDVTSLVKAQQQLQDEKLFIENMVNSASTPLFVINAEHTVLYWNRALEILTGCKQTEMCGTDHHWSAFYTEKRVTLADLVISGYMLNLDELYQAYTPSRYLAGGFQAEGWFEANGTRRYLVFEAAPIKNSAGETVAAIETLEDLTGRRIMEESVRRLTTAVEQTASTVVITDLNGTIEYVNPRFCQSTGYTAEEALGKNPRVLKSGEMSSEGYADLWQTISTGHAWRGEFHNKRKNGELYWEAASISPLLDKEGQITGYLAVKEDITEQKAAREQLQQFGEQLEKQHHELQAAFNRIEQAKREWEQTLDRLHDFIILTDSHHRIRRFNRILADMTGKPITELTGYDWRELLQEVGFTFTAFTGTSGELVHSRSQHTYDISVYPVKGADEQLQGFVISLNDTTELHSTARELEQALAELGEAQSQIYQQEKMASIGQLAAGVAHEINNPMGFITSNLGSLGKYVGRLSEFISVIDQSMQDCGDAELKAPVLEARKRLKIDRILDDAHQLIAESQDGAGRVRRIVQDLKSFSRVDQAETALIDLNEALETTINIAWNEIKYVAEMKREFGDIPRVQCFPQQLNQVFLNLLVNAAHALGDTRGEITVRTEQEGDQVLVKFSDTGCGMTDEVQRRIFEPFFTTKEVGKGTGLGLSISYDIIKKHGGSIEVQSEVGRGTVFTVRLPVAGAEQAD